MWNELENGKTHTEIATKLGMYPGTLARRLQRIDDARYDNIRRKRRHAPLYEIPLREIWNDLEKGRARNELAAKNGIPRTTLSRKLKLHSEKRYKDIMTPRTTTCQVPVVPSETWTELEKGKSLRRLAGEYSMNLRTLANRLLRIDEDRYKAIMQQRTVRRYFGSPEARLHGADSLFELEVRTLLQEHQVPFELGKTVKFGSHRCKPDIILGRRRILEAAGFSTRDYWRHQRQKANDYVTHGHTVFVVVPNELYRRARQYLPRHRKVRLIKYSEFRGNVGKYAEILKGRKQFADRNL